MKFTVVVAIALLVAGAFADGNCQFTVDSHTYDFSALSHVPGDREILYHTTTDGGMLYVNLCNQTTVICPGDNTNVCLLTPEYNYTVRGDLDTVTVGRLEDTKYGENGVTASISSDEMCSDSKTYSTKVHLYCNGKTVPTVLEVAGTEKDCEMVMYVRTKFACEFPVPSSSSSSSTSPSSHKSSSSDASRACYSLVLLVVAFLLF